MVDLRAAFQSRQTIDLQTESPGLTRLEVEEYDTTSEQRQLEIERRFVERHREALEAQEQLAAVIRTPNNVELAAERRRIERDAAIAQASIDSIGQRRIQGSAPASSGNLPTAPISVNYNQSSIGRLEHRSTASIHDFMRQRERARLNDHSHQPRRRNSVVMSNSNSDASLSHPTSLAPGTATPTLSASPSRLSASTSDTIATNTPSNSSDPWQTITDAMSTANVPPDTLRSLQSRTLERRAQATAVQQADLDRPRGQTMVEHAEARGNRARDNAGSLRQMRAAHGRADVVYDEIDRELLLRRCKLSFPLRIFPFSACLGGRRPFPPPETCLLIPVLTQKGKC